MLNGGGIELNSEKGSYGVSTKDSGLLPVRHHIHPSGIRAHAAPVVLSVCISVTKMTVPCKMVLTTPELADGSSCTAHTAVVTVKKRGKVTGVIHVSRAAAASGLVPAPVDAAAPDTL